MEALMYYLVGYVIAYLLIKRWRNKKELNEWGDVFLTLVISLGSWVSCMIILLVLFTSYINNNKPPRFL